MTKVIVLRRIRGIFFFIGFVFSKIKYFPIALIYPAVHLISLSLYLIGHLLAFIGSHIEPEHYRNTNEWQGFLQFKEQYRIGAFFGIAGSLLGISAFYIPVLIVPAAWLFLSSNIFKTIGEYHKYTNPPPGDREYSHTRQNSIVAHALITCLLSTVGALSTTLVYVYPPLAVYILLLATCLSIGLGIMALEFWVDMHFGTHKTSKISESHTYLNASLGPKTTFEVPNHPKPHQSALLFKETQAIPLQLKVLNSTLYHTDRNTGSLPQNPVLQAMFVDRNL
ncbi:MAG: hypothetical protein ACHP6H_04410 [Legionellales bacterium]